jgi:signal transduction histidine kinase
MSLQDNNSKPAPTSPHSPADPAAQLAHELANLLDGSMRHLGIAIDTLRKSEEPDQPDEIAPDTQASNEDDLLHRLNIADQSMKRMASLIHAWMRHSPEPMELFDRSQTLRQTLDQLVQMHWPAASQHGIELGLQVGEGIADLSAGPIFPIVSNAIRNSLDAIIQDPDDHPAGHRIDITVDLQNDQVCLTVRDDGPGLGDSVCDRDGVLVFTGESTKPGGHGVGLMLCRQLTLGLGGELSVTNIAPSGTLLTLNFPAAALRADTQLTGQPLK